MHVAKNRIFSLVLFVSIIMTNYVHADVRPGETCSSVLKLVYQTAFDVGFWEGAMSMAYVEANKKYWSCWFGLCWPAFGMLMC